ncbi:unnamed protein product [Nezara viridula]|uniref:Uncharacterized protein n=1 Tax=Nezara viridula TaxID=85310 RepID=A0A9P0MRB5_NEZVI|nr:unnamed protein product [Nezara viridula]
MINGPLRVPSELTVRERISIVSVLIESIDPANVSVGKAARPPVGVFVVGIEEEAALQFRLFSLQDSIALLPTVALWFSRALLLPVEQ